MRQSLLLLSLLILLASCAQVDQRLVTQVKTVGPRWVELHERMAKNGHNVEVAQERFEKDFKEIEGQLPAIPDSLQDGDYRKEIKAYKSLLAEKDSLATAFAQAKNALQEQVNAFNEWEEQVMRGEVSGEEGMARLQEYRNAQNQFGKDVEEQQKLLAAQFANHNRILRFLASLAQYHHNLDLKIE